MVKVFRVVDLRSSDLDIEIEGAQTPEEAARQALGIEVVRSGSRRDLVAKVYWQPLGQPLTMVRLYMKADSAPHAS